MAIEREVKIRLAAEEACRLAEALGCPLRITHQRNHYLDTPGGALRRRGYGLRLRTEQESHKIQRFLLTLKGPTTIRGVVTEREEQEIEVDRATAEAILAEKVELPRLGLHLPGALSASPTPLALIWGPARTKGGRSGSDSTQRGTQERVSSWNWIGPPSPTGASTTKLRSRCRIPRRSFRKQPCARCLPARE